MQSLYYLLRADCMYSMEGSLRRLKETISLSNPMLKHPWAQELKVQKREWWISIYRVFVCIGGACFCMYLPPAACIFYIATPLPPSLECSDFVNRIKYINLEETIQPKTDWFFRYALEILKGDFWRNFFQYLTQHWFICRTSKSTVSEDAGIKP